MSDASANANPSRQVDELSLYGRLRSTPISDAIRGELSARLSVAYVIDAADSPAPLPQTIMKLVRRTRLWRRERLEVARELISHFQDGVNAGAAPEQLVRDFGDVDRAAKLIRRAKKRNRPLIWKTAVRTVQAIALLPLIFVLLYVPIAVRFFMGTPSITHDYLADLNRIAASVPQNQRAWPVYRDALKGLQSPTELVPVTDPTTAPHPAGVKPGDEHWPVYEQYIRDNADRLALIRKAAAMPGFGFVASTELSPEDAQLWPPPNGNMPPNAPLLYSVFLPYLGEMRKLAYMLVIDTRRAAANDETQVVHDNLAAMFGIAKHTRENALLIGDLISLAIVHMAFERIGELIAQQLDLFTDDQLRDLAHRVAALTDDDLRVRFSSERLSFRDYIQHAYTNNGSGDGRMTSRGMQFFDLVTDATGIYKPSNAVQTTLTPLLGTVMMNRRELLSEYERMMDAMERNAARPLWEREPSPIDAAIHAWQQEPMGQMRRLPLFLLVPAVDHASMQHHYVRGARDATLTAIALELYHRKHGDWPQTLDDLVPSLLPAVPVDRFDGKPLRYVLKDGIPTLYSIGGDLDDDGGNPARRKADGAFDNNEARRWQGNDPATIQAWSGSVDGDWILWKGQPRLEN